MTHNTELSEINSHIITVPLIFYSLHSICVLNLKLIASAVREIFTEFVHLKSNLMDGHVILKLSKVHAVTTKCQMLRTVHTGRGLLNNLDNKAR